MKVVNSWVGVSLWEAFSLTNNYIVSHQKLSMQLSGMEILKNLSEASHRRIYTENPAHGNPSSATPYTNRRRSTRRPQLPQVTPKPQHAQQKPLTTPISSLDAHSLPYLHARTHASARRVAQPHMRRENERRPAVKLWGSGSTPHAQGKRIQERETYTHEGLNPTCAGKTLPGKA